MCGCVCRREGLCGIHKFPSETRDPSQLQIKMSIGFHFCSRKSACPNYFSKGCKRLFRVSKPAKNMTRGASAPHSSIPHDRRKLLDPTQASPTAHTSTQHHLPSRKRNYASQTSRSDGRAAPNPPSLQQIEARFQIPQSSWVGSRPGPKLTSAAGKVLVRITFQRGGIFFPGEQTRKKT